MALLKLEAARSSITRGSRVFIGSCISAALNRRTPHSLPRQRAPDD